MDRAKKLIEDISGRQVLGHRPPAFSVKSNMTWAFEVLLQTGFKYESSIYPIKGRRYGDASVPLEPFPVRTAAGTIWEIPLATLEFLGRRWPACGGGYLRHLPLRYNLWALERINRTRPAVIYMHPYEYEAGTIRPASAQWPMRRKLKYRLFSLLQYRHRRGMKAKLNVLLRSSKFGRVTDVYHSLLSKSEPPPV